MDFIQKSLILFSPIIYLPDTITVFGKDLIVGYISVLDKNNFDLITWNEYECG